MGVPAIITNKGVQEILELELTKQEQEKFDNSYQVLNEMKNQIQSLN